MYQTQIHKQVMWLTFLIISDHLHMLYLIVVTNIRTTDTMMFTDIVPLNGDIAGLAARTDIIADSWYSPAGLNRGVIRGAA